MSLFKRKFTVTYFESLVFVVCVLAACGFSLSLGLFWGMKAGSYPLQQEVSQKEALKGKDFPQNPLKIPVR